MNQPVISSPAVAKIRSSPDRVNLQEISVRISSPRCSSIVIPIPGRLTDCSASERRRMSMRAFSVS